MQVEKWYATVDGLQVRGVIRIKSRNPVEQPNTIEITQEEFERIQGNPDITFFFDEDEELIEAPRSVPYSEARKGEYPDIGEQLDALWKAVRGLYGDVPLPEDVQALADAIDKVKEDHPKNG